MSSRVLKKLGLQGDKDITSLCEDGSDTEADLSSSGGAKKKQLNVNRYDLLNQMSHSESEVKEDDDHETTGSLNAHENNLQGKDAIRKKKKKKKKKPGKGPCNARSSEDNIEDEVERSVREVNALYGDLAQPTPLVADSSTNFPKRSILTIEHRALNPNNELKRIFGSKVIQNEQSKRRGCRSRGHLKSTWLVSPKENWPQVGKPGLSMSLVRTENGVSYFNYEHSINYQQVQKKFLEAVELLNPDNIVSIFNTHPFHIDALLQLSDICKMSEDLQMASELVERALYCLECAFHSSFTFATGCCRLDYRHQVNRSLFVAIFKHINFIGARGLYRTALECCKLLLSLDPDTDPLGIILSIDFYALRSQNYDWLIRFATEYEPSKNLSQLPNFAFSVAVAHFQLGAGNSDVETAHQLLQNALIMFPGVLIPLLDKCNVQTDSRVTSHPFFKQAVNSQSDALATSINMYIVRFYQIWKESELLPWLERNVHAVLDRVDANDPYIKDCEIKRSKRYQYIPINVQRHIILSDDQDIKVALQESTSSTILSFDPLPPVDSINIYSRPQRHRLYENANAVSLFFNSLMPNFNINQPMPDVIPDEEEGATDTGGDFRRSVTSLLDAMRDLLSNIHNPDVPGDGDNEDGGSEEDRRPQA
uniref:Transcription factor 25 n=1 Tax=Clastoptera arizonana TaxID=38151 RepID=A0A1B6CWB0_9HEMI